MNNDKLEINLNMKSDEAVELLKDLPPLSKDKEKDGRKFVLADTPEMIINKEGGRGDGIPRHCELGKNKEVLTAGYIKFKVGANGQIAEISFNRKSKDYCPSAESMQHAKKFTKDLLGVEAKLLEKESNPKCKPTHKVIEEAPYYKNAPQQGHSPEGTLPKGEKVIFEKKVSNHTKVKRQGGKIVYVETKSLEAIV